MNNSGDHALADFIRIMGNRPPDDCTPDEIYTRGWHNKNEWNQKAWDSKLEGFRLARSNGVPAGEADRRDAERWSAVEVLMIAGSLVELQQDEDGGYSSSLEGVECCDQVWKGNTPEEVIDKVVAQLTIAQPNDTKGSAS